MLIINIKDDESIDRALKRYKRKFQSVGLVKELRSLALDLKLISKEGKEVNLDEDAKHQPDKDMLRQQRAFFSKPNIDMEKE
jgi:ribosomal protein S21